MPVPIPTDWLPKLANAWNQIRRDRGKELQYIHDHFGDAELLAKSYIEPDVQPANPADFDEDDGFMTWSAPRPFRDWLNRFLSKPHLQRDGRNTLFLLSDAGMGKTSSLMMLKLSQMMSFWPNDLEFHLLKLGPDTLDQLDNLKAKKKSILLLDALDEASTATGRVEEHLKELLRRAVICRQAIITCRTQFFPQKYEKPGRFEFSGYRCNLLYLSPFTDDQAEEYLRKAFPRSLATLIRKELHRDEGQLQERGRRLLPKLKSLRMRPMLLAYLPDLLEEAGSEQARDWSEYEIYEALVRRWLQREQRRQHQLGKVAPTLESLWEACIMLAIHLQASNEHLLSTELLDNLAERHPLLGQFHDFDLRGQSLLNRTSTGDFRFSHYSIQEFLVAYGARNHTQLLPSNITCTDQIREFLGISIFQPLIHKRFGLVATDLIGASLRETPLEGVDLHGADLEKANLASLNLQRANLTGANLQGANLQGADLRGAKLQAANLEKATLASANLSTADLRGASLRFAVMTDSNLEKACLGRANLQNANLQGTDLGQANLQDADLSRADLGSSRLHSADLQHADLQGASLKGAILHATNLQNASLDGADFSGAKCSGVLGASTRMLLSKGAFVLK